MNQCFIFTREADPAVSQAFMKGAVYSSTLNCKLRFIAFAFERWRFLRLRYPLPRRPYKYLYVFYEAVFKQNFIKLKTTIKYAVSQISLVPIPEAEGKAWSEFRVPTNSATYAQYGRTQSSRCSWTKKQMGLHDL